jgi:ATP-dependent Clp protease ATP-binding subunit ClpC
VILFDELEKAHEDVLNLLLQVMDEGMLTDGKGRKISFKNNIIVMTSNLGSREIAQAAQDSDYKIDDSKLTSNVIKDALEEAMRPELLNRIDEIVVFAPLVYENLKEIAKNLVHDVVKRTKDDSNIQLKVSDNIAEIVTREALSTATVYGARPIRRSVQRYVEDTMAEAIMSEFVEEGDSVTMNLKDPNSGKKIVEIKRSIDNNSLLIDVDEDAGINRESFEMKAAFGEIPKLDDEPPRQDPGSFQ